VADDGKGVAPEVMNELGRPFARAGRTGVTGIGLFVSRQLVSRMKGTLTFARPATSSGLTVVVDLPGTS
jgi:signal transduction histidine kinase